MRQAIDDRITKSWAEVLSERFAVEALVSAFVTVLHARTQVHTMVRRELQPAGFVHGQTDEFRGGKRALVRVKGKQFDLTAIIQCRDHAWVLIQEATRQSPELARNFRRRNLPSGVLPQPIQFHIRHGSEPRNRHFQVHWPADRCS
jgi:hypothetical protein